MSIEEIQKLQDILASGQSIAFIHPSTEKITPVKSIVHGAVACPEEPEVDKCAMLEGGGYVSLFDADIEDFIRFKRIQ